MNGALARLGCAIALLSGCGGDDGTSSDADADTDTDSDSDSDTDTGSGSETDTGVEHFTLSVEMTGPGTGIVRSDDGEIDCDSACAAELEAGTQVVLEGEGTDGFLFHGWTGACSGSTCTITIEEDTTVRAAFVPVLYRTSRALDGSDALEPDGTFTFWTVKTDGTGDAPLPALERGLYYHNGSWSPSGDQIVLDVYSLETDLTRVEVVSADGSDAVVLRDLTQAQTYGPIWTPDGTQIVFESDADPDGADAVIGGDNLWIASADGTGLAAITRFETSSVNDPHVSPDGTKIVYSSSAALDGTDSDTGARNIWVANLDGTDPTTLTHYTTSGITCYPRSSGGWSPDGSEILFACDGALDGSDAFAPDGAMNLWVVAADGSEVRALTSYTTESVYPDDPRWSPDGTRVLFDSAGMLDGSDAPLPSGANNLWVVGADGSGLSHLTRNTVAEHTSGFWSTDGSVVVHESNLTLDGGLGVNDNGVYNVWISNSDGTDPRPLTNVRADGAFVGDPVL